MTSTNARELARQVVEAPALANRLEAPSVDDLDGLDAFGRGPVLHALRGLSDDERYVIARADPAVDGAPWTVDVACALLAARIRDTR